MSFHRLSPRAVRLDRDTQEGAAMDNEALHILIAYKLQDGRLPRSSVPRVFGRPGNGETCDACGVSITKEQMGIEGIALAAGGGRPVQLHANCFQIWETERRKLPRGHGSS
jgi:hypothetical protein